MRPQPAEAPVNVDGGATDQVVMSSASQTLPVTALRSSFERARCLTPSQQIQECVHQLTHPELLASAVIDAHEVMELACFDAAPDDAEKAEGGGSADRGPTLVEDFFWSTRELMVHGDRCSFTCIATNVDPIADAASTGERLSTGLDYVGLTCDDSGTLVLGAVQAPGDTTAYPLLLRLFACLTEISPAPQRERLNRDHLMGIAKPSTCFDLNLVLWDRNDQPETSPISELTRDLAEKLKEALVSADGFPDILRDVVCLRMNPDRFDGRMRFDWRV